MCPVPTLSAQENPTSGANYFHPIPLAVNNFVLPFHRYRRTETTIPKYQCRLSNSCNEGAENELTGKSSKLPEEAQSYRQCHQCNSAVDVPNNLSEK